MQQNRRTLNPVINPLCTMKKSYSQQERGTKRVYCRCIRKNGKIYFVQVAYSVVEEKAYSREMTAFNHMDNSAQKILITTDDIDYSTSVVRHIKFNDFLLMDEL